MSVRADFPAARATGKRIPAKSRRRRVDCPHHGSAAAQPRSRPDWDDRHAPGHLGGSFDDAGYQAGRGAFGFQIVTLP